MSAPSDDRPRPKVRVSKSGRKRIDVPDLIARLERHVHERRLQLEQESKRNTEAKRRLCLLTAVSCGSKAVHQLLADPGDAAARAAAAPTFDLFEAECRSLGAMLVAPEPGSGGEGVASGNVCSSNSMDGDMGMASADGGDPPCSNGGLQQQHGQQRQREEEVDQRQGGEQQQQQQQQQQRQQPPDEQLQLQHLQLQEQHYNAVGLSPRELIHSALAVRDGGPSGVSAFTEDLRTRVRDLAVLLHQHSRGAPIRERMQAAVRGIAQLLTVGLLYQPAVTMHLLNCDLETGQMGDPDPSVWDRCATSLALNKAQADTLSILHFFWQSTSDAMRAERQAIAQRGSEAPADLALQECVLEGLERVQTGASVMTVSVMTIMLTTLLTPQQGAEILVQAWPRMPLLLGLLEAIHRLYVQPASQPRESS